MLKRILVGVTGTPSFATKIDYSLDLAERHGAEVAVISVIDVDRLSDVGPVPIGAGHYAERMVEHRIKEAHALAEEAMRKLEEVGKQRGIPIIKLEKEGDPLEVLAQAYRYYDLLCLSLNGWFDDVVVPEPENALLKLMAGGVRPILGVSEELRPVDKVLIAYNGSPESAKAMKSFVQLQLWGATPVEIVCGGAGATEESEEGLLEDASAYCAAHGLPVTSVHITSDTPQALLDHADAIGADMIVMGGSYRRVLLSQRFGPHTLGLFKAARIPLFITH